ncbi:unnamed protein product [Clavelina lepadiformis]|uniref:Secreted protein n=1 Tax=Clavelina lepadiformis TaxID=159417 RepID=A0ABP0G8K4_CLALP
MLTWVQATTVPCSLLGPCSAFTGVMPTMAGKTASSSTNAPSYHWIIKAPVIGSGSSIVLGYVDLNPSAYYFVKRREEKFLLF